MFKDIELKRVSKYYGSSSGAGGRGIEDIDLALHIGETVLIAGPSGAGKSTLVDVVSQLTEYDQGELYVDGERTSSWDSRKREDFVRQNVALSRQDPYLISTMSAVQNVALRLQLDGLSRKDAIARAKDVLDSLGLGYLKRTPVAKLSGGERARVGIAEAIATDRPLVIFDEPTSNLDSGSADAVAKAIEKARSSGQLVLIATHDIQRFEPISTRCLRIEDGKLVEDRENTDFARYDESVEQAVSSGAGRCGRPSEFLAGIRISLSKKASSTIAWISCLFLSLIAMVCGGCQIALTGVNNQFVLDAHIEQAFRSNAIDNALLLSGDDLSSSVKGALSDADIDYFYDSGGFLSSASLSVSSGSLDWLVGEDRADQNWYSTTCEIYVYPPDDFELVAGSYDTDEYGYYLIYRQSEYDTFQFREYGYDFARAAETWENSNGRKVVLSSENLSMSSFLSDLPILGFGTCTGETDAVIIYVTPSAISDLREAVISGIWDVLSAREEIGYAGTARPLAGTPDVSLSSTGKSLITGEYANALRSQYEDYPFLVLSESLSDSYGDIDVEINGVSTSLEDLISFFNEGMGVSWTLDRQSDTGSDTSIFNDSFIEELGFSPESVDAVLLDPFASLANSPSPDILSCLLYDFTDSDGVLYLPDESSLSRVQNLLSSAGVTAERIDVYTIELLDNDLDENRVYSILMAAAMVLVFILVTILISQALRPLSQTNRDERDLFHSWGLSRGSTLVINLGEIIIPCLGSLVIALCIAVPVISILGWMEWALSSWWYWLLVYSVLYLLIVPISIFWVKRKSGKKGGEDA